MTKAETISLLEGKAREMRKNILRLSDVGGGLHLGGDLSMTDMMTCIFEYMLRLDPRNVDWPDRDRFVLSKGHGAGALYMCMANRGFFKTQDIFDTYGKFDTAFGIHPCRNRLPGVETSTGSLGLGLSICVGMALAARIDRKDYRVVTLMGDGELCEGTVWEAAMAASQFKLGNLVAFIDNNRLSMDGFLKDIMAVEPIAEKFAAFGWRVLEVDGNCMSALVNAVDDLARTDTERPTAVICHTVKGKGVSFMENSPRWHNGAIHGGELEAALNEIDRTMSGGNGTCVS